MEKLKPAYVMTACLAPLFLAALVSCRLEGREHGAPRSAIESAHEDAARAIAATMSAGEKVGQLLFIDLWTDEGEPVRELSDSRAAALGELGPGGVVFYGANLKNPAQIRELMHSISQAVRIPPFLAVDHEGGTVNRLDDSGEIAATDMPAAAVIGRTGDPEYAYRAGRVMGRELASLGFNMNFAPVADVLSAPDSMIGTRSFGSDPTLVAGMVRMAVTGLQETGVCAVLKHFPGHGGASGDTHSGFVYLDREIEELVSRELVPFAAGVEAGADGVMAGHIILGAPGAGGAPAALSRELLTGLLRERLGFSRLIITDSLTMKALAGVERPAVDALRAGADMLLTPGDGREAKSQILAALADGSLSLERIEESVRRIIRIKLERGIGEGRPETSLDVLGCPEHRQVAEEIQRFHSSGE